jgi:hypothetical protein
MDDTTITAPTAPSTLISVNGNGTVDFRGWRHYVYMRDAGNSMMGAIKDHDLTLGSTTMKTYFSAGDVAVSPNGNIYLRRSFTISSQYSPEGNKSIRFYITETELDDLIGADPVSFPDGLNSLTITHYTGYRVDSIFNPIPGGNAVIISNNDITMLDKGNGIYSLDIEVPGFSGFYIGGNNSNLNICPGSTITIPSDVSGSAYQWQVDNGGGFVRLTGNDIYSGTSTRALTIANAPGSIYGYHYRCVVDETIYSQVYTIKINVSWEGTASAAWEDPSNWSCNVLPDSGTEVIIDGNKPNYPQLNSNRTVRSVEISPRATLTITAGYTLQISQ